MTHSALELRTAATVPPVSVAALKRHMRVSTFDDDLYIAELVKAAWTYLDAQDGITGRALTTQTWRQYWDATPTGDLALVTPPVQSVSAITYLDREGSETTFPSSKYRLSRDRDSALVELVDGESWPEVEANRQQVFWVDYVTGLTAVPASYKHAIMMLVGHWYENREGVTVDVEAHSVPLGFDRLVATMRTPESLI